MEFHDRWNYYTTLTESMLKVQMDQSEAPSILLDGMNYSLTAGGKRLRPVICLAVCDMLGETASEALLAACALEMIHTYSLIHDDLPAMDDDDLRRGKPSNHKVFGEANAILAGDGLLSLAMVLLNRVDNKKVCQAVTRGALDMVYGQSMDLNGKPDAETLFKIHEKKTGALLKAAVLAGAHTANANAKQIEILSTFAEHFGLLFQITDDILDATGTAEQLGKTAGKDERDNKVTFVTVYGLDGARSEAEHVAEAALEDLKELNLETGFLEEMVYATLNRES